MLLYTPPVNGAVATCPVRRFAQKIVISRRRRILWALFSAALLLFLASYVSVANQTDTAVIVNPSVAQTEVSRNTLRAIFGMRMRAWSDDQPIRVFVLPDDDPLHTGFCKGVLQVFAHQMRQAWDRGVFSGTGQAPTVVSSMEELVQKVAATEGAIGYAMGSSIDDQVVELDVR